MKTMAGTAVVLIAVLSGPAARAQSAGGFLGRPLAAVQQTDLFSFFSLTQTARQPCGDGEALGFRPAGDKFHKLAAVEVVTGGKQAVTAVSLALDRGFIDAPGDGVFARDIAKSFLLDAAGSPTDGPVAALAAEIASSNPPGTTQYVLNAPPPKPPGPSSDCFQVFTGGRASCEQTVDRATLTMRADRLDGEAVVRMTLAISGQPPASCVMSAIAE
jgi:hypothetical protein